MCVNTPEFWYREDKSTSRIQGRLLSPISKLYEYGSKLRQKLTVPYKSRIPVICVGNLTAGGNGKTPTAIALSKMVGADFCFLSRGHGGEIHGPHLVDKTADTAHSVGDEPLLLAEYGPVIISRNRKKGALFAEKNGFKTIIMDDGFQNPGVHKDLSVIVVDGTRGFGNGKIIPSGPLREPISEGIERSQAVIIIGDDKQDIAKNISDKTQIIYADLATTYGWIPDTKARYVAFSGIGNPEKFRNSLEESRINIITWKVFSDHHKYSEKDLLALKSEAAKQKARLITTAKDFVRLPASFRESHHIDVLPVELVWQDQNDVQNLINTHLKRADND